MNTPAQLRLAADILETGHPWEYKSLVRDEWNTGKENLTTAIAWGHEIRPALATPPYPATLHNPDNLTAEQVGVGYRLVLPSEIDGRFANQCEGWWYGKWQKADMAQDKTSTYRLPLSVPWPEQPKPSGCIWRHDEDGNDITAYRVLKTREPKPKVPLGPEDVTPFTLFRVKLECGVVERVTSWITPLAISTQGVKFHWPLDPVSWTRLARDYERNNSLETGKWDATKWEACEK